MKTFADDELQNIRMPILTKKIISDSMMNHDFGYNIMSYFAVIIDYNPYQMFTNKTDRSSM